MPTPTNRQAQVTSTPQRGGGSSDIKTKAVAMAAVRAAGDKRGPETVASRVSDRYVFFLLLLCFLIIKCLFTRTTLHIRNKIKKLDEHHTPLANPTPSRHMQDHNGRRRRRLDDEECKNMPG
jgi:hypothetical protein